MNSQKHTQVRRLRRRNHVRSKIHGTVERPRLTVFRSSKHIYAQLIDDMNGHTIISVGSLTPELHKDMPYGGNIKAAQAVGRKLAEVAKEKGITKAAFDRGHYRYHGRIKALAEAANAAGLLCCEPKPKKKARMEAEAAAAPAQAEPAAASGKKEKKEKKSK